MSIPTQISPDPPRRGEVCVEASRIYLSTFLPKMLKIGNYFKRKLCYLQYAIISYSNFFISFNFFSWIYDFCYHYITNLLFNFCYFPSNFKSFLFLVFVSFLRFLLKYCFLIYFLILLVIFTSSSTLYKLFSWCFYLDFLS